MDSQKFCLKWNNFQRSVTSVFDALRADEELVDITLCCEGKKIKAHRVMLSACSPYFRDLLKENPCQHPVFFLKDTSHEDLRAVIEFVYKGEVNVVQSQLASFLKTAEMLQVRGLTGDDDEQEQQMEQQRSSAGTRRTVKRSESSASMGERPPSVPPLPTAAAAASSSASQSPQPAKRCRLAEHELPPLPLPDHEEGGDMAAVATLADTSLDSPKHSPRATDSGRSASRQQSSSPLPSTAHLAAAAAVATTAPSSQSGAVSTAGHGAAVKVEKVDLIDIDDDSLDTSLSASQMAAFEAMHGEAAAAAAAAAGGSGDGSGDLGGALDVGDRHLSGLLHMSHESGMSLGDVSGRYAGTSDDNSQASKLGITGGYLRVCELCNKPLFSMSSYTCHMSMHRGSTMCPQCGRVLSSRQRLLHHYQSKHVAQQSAASAAPSSSSLTPASLSQSSTTPRPN